MARGGKSGTRARVRAKPRDEARADGLMMDYASRMKRAGEQGFDTGWFHGAVDDISAFDPSRSSGAAAFGPGTYLTRNPDDAAGWAHAKRLAQGGNENVMPLAVRTDNVLKMEPMSEDTASRLSEYLGRELKAGDPPPLISLENRGGSVSEGARAAGFAALQHAGPDGQLHMVVMDPSTIRSVNAAFDPANAGKNDLLGAVSGAAPYVAAGAAGTGALLGTGEAEAAFLPATIKALRKVEWDKYRLNPRANRANLMAARKMFDEGVDPRVIYEQTGMFRGADGKMRYEVPDNNAGISRAEDDPDQILLEHEAFDELFPRNPPVIKDANGQLGGARGRYTAGNPGRIQIDGGLGEPDQLSTTMHEVQHDIQHHAGFAQGSNPDAVYGQIMDEVVKTRGKSGMPEALERRRERDLFGSTRNYRSDLYRRVAGEVEARNVQRRLDMTPEQRAASYPKDTEDIARDLQIMVENPLKAPYEGALAGAVPLAGALGAGAALAPGEAEASILSAGRRIAQRFPTAKRAEEDPMDDTLRVDVASMNDMQQEAAAAALRTYPQLRLTDKRAPDAIQSARSQMVDNLLALHSMAGPDAVRSKEWYVGANRYANTLAGENKLSTEQASAVIAALSPQKDWFQNASLARRVIEIDGMAKQGNYVVADAGHKRKVRKLFDKKTKGTGKNERPLTRAERKVVIADVKAATTLPYDQLTPRQRAMWVRSYDEAYNDRGYPIVAPEGVELGSATTNDGSAGVAAWGSNAEIAKALSVLDDGSLENISRAMGEQHKVRNFYNNIADPMSPMDDVTGDTHQVGANLFSPMSGSSREVTHNFGSNPKGEQTPIKNSAFTGVKGTYPIHADAVRDAARQLGLQPREVQSITWEAVRGLFPDWFKRNQSNLDDIDGIWRLYQGGAINQSDARRLVEERTAEATGGMVRPDWTGGGLARDAGQRPPADGRYVGDAVGAGRGASRASLLAAGVPAAWVAGLAVGPQEQAQADVAQWGREITARRDARIQREDLARQRQYARADRLRAIDTAISDALRRPTYHTPEGEQIPPEVAQMRRARGEPVIEQSSALGDVIDFVRPSPAAAAAWIEPMTGQNSAAAERAMSVLDVPGVLMGFAVDQILEGME